MLKTLALGLMPAAIIAAAVRLGIGYHWIAVTLYHIFCVLVPLLMRRTAAEAGLARSGGRRWIVATAVLSALLLFGMRFGGGWLYGQDIVVPRDSRALLLHIEPFTLIVLDSILINPFAEEYFWRGFLLPRSGIVLGAALFGFMHFAGIVHYMPPLTAMLLSLPTLVEGLAWGWMRRASGSLWPCVVTHMAADAGILWLIGAIRAMA
jgi:membrane protease YdiL (CAAX protease family)